MRFLRAFASKTAPERTQPGALKRGKARLRLYHLTFQHVTRTPPRRLTGPNPRELAICAAVLRPFPVHFSSSQFIISSIRSHQSSLFAQLLPIRTRHIARPAVSRTLMFRWRVARSRGYVWACPNGQTPRYLVDRRSSVDWRCALPIKRNRRVDLFFP
jgi:hypothetical protein